MSRWSKVSWDLSQLWRDDPVMSTYAHRQDCARHCHLRDQFHIPCTVSDCLDSEPSLNSILCLLGVACFSLKIGLLSEKKKCCRYLFCVCMCMCMSLSHRARAEVRGQRTAWSSWFSPSTMNSSCRVQWQAPCSLTLLPVPKMWFLKRTWAPSWSRDMPLSIYSTVVGQMFLAHRPLGTCCAGENGVSALLAFEEKGDNGEAAGCTWPPPQPPQWEETHPCSSPVSCGSLWSSRWVSSEGSCLNKGLNKQGWCHVAESICHPLRIRCWP